MDRSRRRAVRRRSRCSGAGRSMRAVGRGSGRRDVGAASGASALARGRCGDVADGRSSLRSSAPRSRSIPRREYVGERSDGPGRAVRSARRVRACAAPRVGELAPRAPSSRIRRSLASSCAVAVTAFEAPRRSGTISHCRRRRAGAPGQLRLHWRISRVARVAAVLAIDVRVGRARRLLGSIPRRRGREHRRRSSTMPPDDLCSSASASSSTAVPKAVLDDNAVASRAHADGSVAVTGTIDGTTQPLHRQLGLTDDELGGDRRAARPRAHRARARDVRGDVVGALLLQVVEASTSAGSPPRRRGCSSGPGEGAGVIDVGDGLAVAHPHREPQPPVRGRAVPGRGDRRRRHHPRHLLDGRPPDRARWTRCASARSTTPAPATCSKASSPGISGYGNAVGVPTVGGEVVFDDCYRDNPLVNVLCLGLLPVERLVLAQAEGVGNLAVLLGSSTGRDGIGGASVLASAGFEEGSRGQAAVGAGRRPVRGEAAHRGVPRAARRRARGRRAGPRRRRASRARRRRPRPRPARAWTSTSRACAKREPGMNAVEVMTSESQERMLAIVTPDEPRRGARPVRALGDPRLGRSGGSPTPAASACSTACSTRSACPARTRRRRAATTRRRCRPTAPPIADVPVEQPRRRPGVRPPAARARRPRRACRPTIPRPRCAPRFPAGTDLVGRAARAARVARPSPTSRGCGASTTTSCSSTPSSAPGGDAAVLRLKGTAARARAHHRRQGAASAALDPRTGARLAVLEAARNVACVGATPRALVNCLNFGNPEHPEVMWQFSEVVDGMSEACRALGIPVVGGNVSFYNESRGRDIDPTPVVGVVGLIDELDVGAAAGPRCATATRIVLLGRTERRARRLGVGARARPARRHAAGGRPRRRGRAARLRARARRRRAWSPACTTAPTAGSRSRSPRWRSPAECGFDVALGPSWCRRSRGSRSRRRVSSSPSTRRSPTTWSTGRRAAGVPARARHRGRRPARRRRRLRRRPRRRHHTPGATPSPPLVGRRPTSTAS